MTRALTCALVGHRGVAAASPMRHPVRACHDQRMPHIGTLNEGSLHAALKAHYARPGDQLEVPLHGFVIDIRRDDLLVEVQTGSFGALGNKLDRLLDEHKVLLVHPIAVESYLARPGRKERRSPLRGSIHDLFEELVSLPTLLDHPNLSLDVALVSLTVVQEADPRARRGRGGFRTVDRQLRDLREVRSFRNTADLSELLPAGLPREFTTADLARRAGVSRNLAQRMAFCFRALEVIREVDRSKRGIVYARG